MKEIWCSSDVIKAFLKAYEDTFLLCDITEGVKFFADIKTLNLKVLISSFYNPWQDSPLKQIVLVLPKCISSLENWNKSPLRWFTRFTYALLSFIFSFSLTKMRDIAPVLDGIVLNLGAIYNKLSFETVRNCTIILDDIERKSDNLKIKEVLGLVTFLREERGCSVVLIMGDDKDNKDDIIVINKYREKVLEKEFQFTNTSENCYDYAEPDLGEFEEIFKHYLLALFEKLDCKNIRLISKVKLIIKTLSEHKGKEINDFAELISNQVVITIIGIFRPNEYQFEKLGFSNDQELSNIISSFLVNKVTEKKILSEYFDKKYFEKNNAQTRNIFHEIWLSWVSSLANNSEAVKQMILNDALPLVKHWIPSELYNAIFYLDAMDEQDLVMSVLRDFEEKNCSLEAAFNPTDDGFGNKGYPENKHFLTVASKYKILSPEQNFKYIMDEIFQNDVLRKDGIEVLAKASTEQFKEYFLSCKDGALPKKFNQYISFIRTDKKLLTSTVLPQSEMDFQTACCK